MCLLSVAWNARPDYPFVFAGNRDEFHARESAAADWWEDAPDVFGGRDLVAGGSWLGINRDGRFAVVTNRPDLPAPDGDALSRGDLVGSWLAGTAAHAIATVSATSLAERSQRYGGFSLLAGNVTAGSLSCFNGGNGMHELQTFAIEPGVFGLSNTAVDDPWPKLTWLNAEIGRLLDKPTADAENLFELLLRRDPVPDADTDWVSARPFIVGDEYGTRSATVITVNKQGECRFIERRFGPGGAAEGETDERFAISLN